MNELEFAKKVAQQLHRSAHNLGQVPIARLKAARERALQAYRSEPVLVHADGSTGGKWSDRLFHHPRLALGGLAALLALAVGLNFWQQTEIEKSPIDAQILASDLPLHAFTQQNFDAWLKNNSKQ
ncbi:MAG: DUF3619 family protein [Pseudomonadota bacterium]|nr:DUF3619 family protein [Pseudomonadota bacterium]